jgi:hypothetical protein
MGKNQDPDPESVPGMNNPDHISESLETIFLIKILKCFDAYPGSGIGKIRNRDPVWKTSESGSGIRDSR